VLLRYSKDNLIWDKMRFTIIKDLVHFITKGKIFLAHYFLKFEAKLSHFQVRVFILY
jgi:hypothetical protein